MSYDATAPENIALEAIKQYVEKNAPQESVGMANDSSARPNDITVNATYTPPGSIIPGTFSSANVRTDSILFGQTIMGKGTTIANPLRSDPRVEAVLGKQEYKVKKDNDSPDQQSLKIARLENMVEALLKERGQVAVAASITAPRAEYEDDFDGMALQDLKTIAKQIGVKCPVGLEKEEIIARLRKAKYAGSTV
jgi:hypothetical protein